MPDIPQDAGSAGVLKSTLSDIISYINHQLKEKDKRVLLSHNLTWGNKENFGIGLNWSLKTNFDGQRKIWASGGTFGFSSYSVLYPDRNFAVLYLPIRMTEVSKTPHRALLKPFTMRFILPHWNALRRGLDFPDL